MVSTVTAMLIRRTKSWWVIATLFAGDHGLEHGAGHGHQGMLMLSNDREMIGAVIMTTPKAGMAESLQAVTMQIQGRHLQHHQHHHHHHHHHHHRAHMI